GAGRRAHARLVSATVRAARRDGAAGERAPPVAGRVLARAPPGALLARAGGATAGLAGLHGADGLPAPRSWRRGRSHAAGARGVPAPGLAADRVHARLLRRVRRRRLLRRGRAGRALARPARRAAGGGGRLE